MMMIELLHHNGAMLSTGPGKTGLSVAIEIESARHQPTRYESFPDFDVYDFALPCNVA